ncbi:MAG: DUF6825 family protein [Cyanobacteria bacterium J06648_11]
MTNPLTRAFFVGRATATLLSERVEATLTDFASEMGRAAAEWQEQWRLFGEEALARAAAEEALAAEQTSGSTPSSAGVSGFPAGPADLQETLDDLRAEVAQLRSELQRYRSQS